MPPGLKKSSSSGVFLERRIILRPECEPLRVRSGRAHFRGANRNLLLCKGLANYRGARSLINSPSVHHMATPWTLNVCLGAD